MKAAIYIRVSTEEQAKEGYSISGQMKKLKAYCISQGWEVAGIYPDEGISAKDMKRPELQRMIKDIEKGEVNCVLVYRLDRLTRSVLDLYKMLEVFEEHDCKFKSATEVYDTTSAMGRMFITIVAALAQWERENMGERISFGYIEKARQGKYTHNVVPMGYDLDKGESKLYVNEVEAKTVREIFDLYQTMGGNRVSRKLNDRGMYTKAGKMWSDNTIMKIIRNPIYYGSIMWLDEVIDNTHEGIISKEYWDKTQAIIDSRRTKSPRSVSSNYIFSGKLRCNNCDSRLTGFYTSAVNVSGERIVYPQYRCIGKRNGQCDKSRSISETKLEKAFVDILASEDYDSFFDEAVKKTEKTMKDKPVNDNVDYDKKLQQIEARKKKWQYAWTDDIMSYDDFKARMDEANKEVDELKALKKAQPSDSDDDVDVISQSDIISLLKDVGKSWSGLEALEKKNLVDSFIGRIHTKQKGNVLTITKIDFKEFKTTT